jgi:ribonucleotide reductase alpha subunit
MLKHSGKIEEAIKTGHANDAIHGYFGANTLRKQYLLRLGYDVSTISENIQYFYMRIAVEMYHKCSILGVGNDGDIDAVITVYHHLSQQLYTHATPTLLNAGTKHNQMSSCFVKDTEVITVNDGPKKIQDVKIGDTVITHLNRKKLVKQLHKNPLNGRKIMKLSVSKTKDIYVTDNHRFWSSTNKKTAGWKRVDELSVGDYIGRPKSLDNYKSNNYEFTIDDINFLKVENIEITDRQDEFVYTLGVEDDHSYTVEGLVCENCFLLTIDDHLNDILYTGVGDVGMISRYNGGIGIDISRLRHSEIGNDGQSKGISPVLHLYNAVTRYVDQGGKRNGAETVFLRSHHYDFPEFVKSIEKTGDKYDRNHDIHISGWTSWLFWERVASDKDWTMFCPNKTKELNDLYGEQFNERYIKYEQEAELFKTQLEQCKAEIKELEKDPMCIENPMYRIKNIQLSDLVKRQINYRKMPARELLKLMTEVQMHSEGPFIMNGDSCNIKSNHRHRGYIRSSNLCQEIVEYTSKDEIASCNLASISLKMFVKSKVNHKYLYECKTQEALAEHLRECYDFNKLGEIVGWIVRNLNMVIDNNFYPLDEMDKDGNIIKRGKIATTNYKSRPLGIGVSGLSDMLARMDLAFCADDAGRVINPVVELLNKMVFACIEFNGLVKSVEMALTHGPYETFVVEGKKCPYAEGKFQHDLWAEEYKVLSRMRERSGINNRSWVRKAEDDIAMSPECWGQKVKEIRGYHVIKSAVFGTEFGHPVECEIEPSWESLRKHIMRYGLYNSLITAIMPTATTSQIIGNCESTEAHMNIIYARETKSGFYIITNEYLCRDLQEIGLLKDDIMNNIRNNWDGTLSGIIEYVKTKYPEFKDFDRLKFIRKKYMTAFELSNRIFMKMAADRGRYIDQSQSLNVFMPKVSTEAMSALLYYGYDLGLKTVMYYLYQKKFSQIAKFGELAAEAKNEQKADVKIKDVAVQNVINNSGQDMIKNASDVKNVSDNDTTSELDNSLNLTAAEVCRRDAMTGKKICEMCT